MLRGFFCSSLLLGITFLTSASSIIPRQNDKESLKSALDAVTRKQRSLDFSPRDYYNDLRNFKYHPNDDDNEEKFARQQNQYLDDNDEDLEFLPLEDGQLENIGGGYQNFNNKRLERALMDYFENPSGQRDKAPSSSSSFRERERTGGHKRALLTSDRSTSLSNDPDKDLAALLYKELHKAPLYNGNDMSNVDNQEYMKYSPDTLQSYYDQYLAEQAKNQRNKLYGANNDPMSWGEIFSKQETLKNRGSKNNIVDSMNNNDDDDDDTENEEGYEDVASFVNAADYANRHEHEQDPLYILPAERRNVNGRFPLGREYGLLLKRYPLTKRSPKPLHHEKEPSGVITDPKVAKDLGGLFGGQSRTNENVNNRTNDGIIGTEPNNEHRNHDNEDDHGHNHNHDNDHEHHHEHDYSGNDHDHSGHDHDHSGHDHDHSGHDHDHSGHEHDKSTVSPGVDVTTPSEIPKIMLKSPKSTPGQKEITNPNNNNNSNNGRASKLLSKRDHRNVELTKKSVDWSQYFGIDRRKKKSALLALPGSQDQDDEWMLQRYYKTMAENLKSPDNRNNNSPLSKDNSEKRDKLDQMDERLKSVKNLIVEDALKYGNEENSDSQEVKDVVMRRLAAAYSLEKMRLALNEFRSNIAAKPDLMRATTHAKISNVTNNFHESTVDDKMLHENEKRNGHGIDDENVNPYEGRNYEGFDEGRGCPALDAIVHKCPHIGGKLSGVQELCIMHQMCRACDNEDEDCTSMFAFGVDKICETIGVDPRKCVPIVSSYWAREPSSMVVASCHSGPDSCLRRTYRYRHRGIYYQNGWPSHVAQDTLQLTER